MRRDMRWAPPQTIFFNVGMHCYTSIMANVFVDSWETYKEHIGLVLLFSIPFIIAFLIPLFAPLPTYISSGAIFLRSASVFLNLTAFGVGVIIISLFLALLFLSFAFVAISLIVKAKRTHTKVSGSVIHDIEKYTGRVFAILLIYAAVLIAVEISSYYVGLQGIATPLVGFFLFVAIFYAPAAVVLENKKVFPAIRQSARLVAKEPQYFLLWAVAIAAVVSAVDLAMIALTGALMGPSGTLFSSYALLVLNSLFILPYFVIYQAEAYMRRFSILKH